MEVHAVDNNGVAISTEDMEDPCPSGYLPGSEGSDIGWIYSTKVGTWLSPEQYALVHSDIPAEE